MEYVYMKEKYKQLYLACQFGGIKSIEFTQMISATLEKSH